MFAIANLARNLYLSRCQQAILLILSISVLPIGALSCTGFSFGLDLACLEKGYFGKIGTDKLIDQYRKKGDISDKRAMLAQRFGFKRHAERNTCLRKEGDSKIFYDVAVAFYRNRAEARAEVFA